MPPKSDKRKKTMKFGSSKPNPSDARPPRMRKVFKQEKTLEVNNQGLKEEDEDPLGNSCVLCCEDIEIFAKGSCDHVICYKCCSRMRVLCQENYCAVCRLELNQVVFMERSLPFADMTVNRMLSNLKYGIFFESMEIKKKFQDLLLNKCPLCGEKSARFEDLRRHVRHKHEKQYCDICVQNLKIFPHEFRVYTRSELVTHRKSGDSDDKSYKGHPQCEFCNERYFDNDELLLHLRKNHFWCHFCEKDGKQEYYETYEDLRAHFGSEHFLCEENECLHEKYTSVFRTDIDYQAHKVAKHSKKLTKMAAKQARQLNVEIDYGTRKQYQQRLNGERRLPSRQERASKKVTVNKDSAEANVPSDEESGGSNKNTVVSEASGQNVKSTSPLSADATPFFPSSQPSQANNDEERKTKTMADKIGSLSQKPEPLRSKSKGDVSTQRRNPEGKRYDAAFPPLGEQSGNGARPKDSSPMQQHSGSQSIVNGIVQSDKKKAKVMQNKKSDHVDKKQTSEMQKSVKPPPGIKRETLGQEKVPPGLSVRNSEPPATKNLPPGFNKQGLSVGIHEPTVTKKLPPGFNTQNKVSNIENSNPEDAKERNAALVGLIKSLLSEENFSKFRELSGSFRRSDITDTEYYKSTQDLFGKNLDLVFSELVELLPDKGKQKQLWKIHIGMQMFPILTKGEEMGQIRKQAVPAEPKSAWTEANGSILSESSRKSENNTAKSSAEASNQPPLAVKKRRDKDFTTCKECGETIPRKEVASHMDTHIDSDFPALPSFSKPRKHPSWQQRPAPVIHNSWTK